MSPLIVSCKFLLLLSFISAVCPERQKRDVHRIIIQERVPRSHKKGPTPIHKRGKHPHHDSDSSSYESSDSFSRESSSEEVFRSVKNHKAPIKKNPTHRSPRHPKLEDSHRHTRRQKSKSNFQNDWVPLNSDQIMQHSEENIRIQDRRNKRKDAKSIKDKQKKNSTKSLHVLDLTTSYPLLHFEGSTLYPTISWFPHILEGDQTPMMSAVDYTKFGFSNAGEEERLKNHKSVYDEDSDENHEIIVGKYPKTHSRKREGRSKFSHFD